MHSSSLKAESYKMPEWPQDFRENYLRQGLWNNETFDQCIADISQSYTVNVADSATSSRLSMQHSNGNPSLQLFA